MTLFTGERGPQQRPALSRLIGISPSDFADVYWGSQPLLTRGDLLPNADDLFSADAVDELVARRGLRTPFIRMANEGAVLPAMRFTGSGGFGAEVGDQVDSAKVFAEFAAGATIVLQGLHRTWTPIAAFTRRLAADIGHPCQVNAYVTPAQSRGFDPHYDVHDVFVVQISGEKQWRIHEPALIDPLPHQPWTSVRAGVERRASGAPALDVTLRPGDVLYLPRGWIHSATSLGGTSVHLTVGVAALTRRDLIDVLLDAIDTDSLRASLPMGVGDADAEALAPAVADTIAALTSALSADGLTAAATLGVRARVRASIRPDPIDPLHTVDALVALDADTVVRWRFGQPTELTTTADSVRLDLGATTLTFPREAHEALIALMSGVPRAVTELPGLDTQSAIVVSRRLLREGVLVVERAPRVCAAPTELASPIKEAR